MIELRPGRVLSTLNGDAFCRLGAIVQDVGGKLYGLTARHILEAEDDPVIFDAATSTPVGYRVELPVAAEGDEFFHSIGLFEIDTKFVSIDMTHDLVADMRIAPPDYQLTGTISKLGPDGVFQSGELIGYGGSIYFKASPESTSVVLKNVIEIVFHSGAEATCRGEAGSPILNEDGAIIGLLIAGSEVRAYAAPISGFLEIAGLRPVKINRENSIDLDRLSEELSEELREASFGAEQLRHDISLDNGLARDPYKEDMPKRFLDALAVQNDL
jgi:hypothetical protein